MNRHVLTQYGIRDPTPVHEPHDRPQPITLPTDHPCNGCIVLRMDSGVPYCFLPHCNRDIFRQSEVQNE